MSCGKSTLWRMHRVQLGRVRGRARACKGTLLRLAMHRLLSEPFGVLECATMRAEGVNSRNNECLPPGLGEGKSTYRQHVEYNLKSGH